MDYFDFALSVFALGAFGLLAFLIGTAWAWIAFCIWAAVVVSQIAYFLIVKKSSK